MRGLAPGGAQTSLRSIIGKSELDDLLSNREKLNQGLELMIDSPAVEWGVTIDRVEIKDVSLPETMKRSMARQAEADPGAPGPGHERGRRAPGVEEAGRGGTADGGHARGAATAAAADGDGAVAAEKNSTLVLPFPVELLRFLEKAQQQLPAAPAVSEPRMDQGGEGPKSRQD